MHACNQIETMLQVFDFEQKEQVKNNSKPKWCQIFLALLRKYKMFDSILWLEVTRVGPKPQFGKESNSI
jgi:hypothetical protein